MEHLSSLALLQRADLAGQLSRAAAATTALRWFRLVDLSCLVCGLSLVSLGWANTQGGIDQIALGSLLLLTAAIATLCNRYPCILKEASVPTICMYYLKV